MSSGWRQWSLGAAGFLFKIQDILVTCPAAVTQNPDKQFKGGIWLQELEAASHLFQHLERKNDRCWRSGSFLLSYSYRT